MNGLLDVFGKRAIAVLIYDGEHWHAGVFARSRHGGELLDATVMPSSNLRPIKSDLMQFMTERRVTSVRMLIPTDLHSAPMEAPADVDSEELHTALAYEMAGEIGMEAHLLRLAMAEAAVYGMGGEKGVFLAAGFDSRMLEDFAAQFRQAGIDFEGCGALELGLLALHARHPEARLLLLRRGTGFLAEPACENSPFQTVAAPVGLKTGDSERDLERLDRLRRRLRMACDLPLRVVTATADGVPADARAREIVGDIAVVEVVALDDVMPDLMGRVMESRVVDSYCACPLIGPPPAPRDPHRAGTWVCLALLALMTTYALTRWHHLRADLKYEQKRMQEWSVIVAERGKASSHYDGMRRARNQQNQMFEIMSATNRLPSGLLPILDALATAMPMHTRITILRQVGDNAFELHGKTRWSQGKIRLHRLLSDTLGPLAFLVEPGKLQFIADAREQEFSFEIRSVGDGI